MDAIFLAAPLQQVGRPLVSYFYFYLLIITDDILLAAPLPLGGPASGILLPFLPADHSG